MARYRRGKSEEKPRYRPPAQTGRSMNPLFARILKISERLGEPMMYKRDLIIDRDAIARQHPSAVLWGVRDTGTHIICLSRGTHKGAATGSTIFGTKVVSYYAIAKGHIEYPNRNKWYYITANEDRRVSKEEALTILQRYAKERVWSGL
jgi:hypothetical protein